MTKSKLNNRHKIAILGVVLLLILTITILTACDNKDNEVDDCATCYDIVLSYDNGVITASQDVLYQAQGDIENIVFRLYPNAMNNGGENDNIKILSCKIDMLNADYDIYGTDKSYLSIPCKMAKGDVCTISLEYQVNVGKSNDRLGITSIGVANLNHFYPILAHYDNGWREDEYCKMGDPFFHDVATYFVSVNCDKDLSVASSGNVQNIQYTDNKKTVQIDAENIRDFALVIGDLKEEKTNIELEERSVGITYYYYSDANIQSTLSRIEDSIQVFSRAFGDYAYNDFCLTQSVLTSGSGMEYGGFALVGYHENYDEYLDVITHEIAHQWWYSAVGNDQIFNAWLDEGLSEFCTYYYHYLKGDRGVYRENIGQITTAFNDFNTIATPVGYDGNMNKALKEYLTDGEYVATTYYKGAMLFDLLHSLMTEEKFNQALSTYYTDNKFKIATPTSLAESFKSVGYDITPIIDSYASNTI